ncbi:WhiB family transcription factor [Gordonia phage Skysand]|uniref:WhiB family transcription factor n=1 Tax=Gordonia phage Skysand TaxID=2301559 RepID=A0A385DU98_9CAUD|nr:transcriptional regulator WhiB-like [Gordonia phage Skysand]AXQ62129.1 WhiB family transcription factor [Gordonia phage Skysand]
MSQASPLLAFPLSPAQRAVNWRVALCCADRFQGRWLWDAELDGGGEKNAKGESSVARADRHEAAKTVCRACPERLVCLAAGRSDPRAEGIYGGELITRTEGLHRGHRQGSLRAGLPASGSDLRREEDAVDHSSHAIDAS